MLGLLYYFFYDVKLRLIEHACIFTLLIYSDRSLPKPNII